MKKYNVYVSKRNTFDVESKILNQNLSEAIEGYAADSIHLVNHYLVEVDGEVDIHHLAKNIFSEPNVDVYSIDDWDFSHYSGVIPVRYLPGQYDQRSDSASQCLKIMAEVEECKIRTAKIYCFYGNMSEEVLSKVETELVNPIESMVCSLEELNEFEEVDTDIGDLKKFHSLMNSDDENLHKFIEENSLAMSVEDLRHIRDYFSSEGRVPNILELKALDTYWSDHCRHTTFTTTIDKVELDTHDSLVNNALAKYYRVRTILGRKDKPVTLMDMATINSRDFISRNPKHNIDISEEINACSINVKCKMDDGSKRRVLLMFKNETHNHPTEIEPFGGAATCLGGAIRDPLSGRAYVYGAMRVTGAADPTAPRSETIDGKLPQYRICKDAAKGYSSYGNQIGIATGMVREFYHPGFLAKRFELGAVIASTPKENVIRLEPQMGDVVVLVGGKTGRDGIGGATGSSKSHDGDSLVKSGSEVQKGNAPTERKLLRLFMKPELAKMIKRCNDFGAGGVAVAVGEIAPSIDIDLDAVPRKYLGLNPMETAISESQERMAVVISADNWEAFDKMAHNENLEATVIAKITDSGRLRMYSGGDCVLDLARSFLDSGGVTRTQSVDLTSEKYSYEEYFKPYSKEDLSREGFEASLKQLQNSSQKGLIEMFDGSIGTTSVFSPLGGRHRISPSDVMVNKILVGEEISNTMSAMSFGYDPYLAELSPMHGAYYAVVMSIARIVAAGFSNKKVKLTLQEYFEKLGTDSKKWGKPFLALLGAMKAQFEFDVAAIGGKDSMSGTFKDIDVPPSLVSFAVSYGNKKPVPNCLKAKKSKLYLLLPEYKRDGTIEMPKLLSRYDFLLKKRKAVLSAKAIDHKGLLVNIYEMAAGNRPNVKLNKEALIGIYSNALGGILVQGTGDVFDGRKGIICLGKVSDKADPKFVLSESYDYSELESLYTSTLEGVYPIKKVVDKEVSNVSYGTKVNFMSLNKYNKPRVFIPVFPGTNCEIDTARAFRKAGADCSIGVFRNERSGDISESINLFREEIEKAQILAIPGGFSAGDEPEGSAKFIASVFKNPALSDAVNDLIKNRDGLVIGICNGFQALIKLGVFENGEISEISEDSPTLTYNSIGRHAAGIVRIRIASTKSPWLSHAKTGDVYNVPISHGEGRFVANDEVLKKLIERGQIAAQYADLDGNATMDPLYNPNGSTYAVEALLSLDGHVLGKMGHTERYHKGIYTNVSGSFDTELFKSGVNYFK